MQLADYNGAFYIKGQNPEYTGLRTYSRDRFKKADHVCPSAVFVIAAGYSRNHILYEDDAKSRLFPINNPAASSGVIVL
jgi:hypothetical protein